MTLGLACVSADILPPLRIGLILLSIPSIDKKKRALETALLKNKIIGFKNPQAVTVAEATLLRH
jgi:hypothetical protein